VNWLAFWASVIGSLGWPAAIVIALLIFRKQLVAAAPWLRELEVGDVSPDNDGSIDWRRSW